jgi:hypothetical protein
MEMGSGTKFSKEFIAPCNYPWDPSNKPVYRCMRRIAKQKEISRGMIYQTLREKQN